MSVRTRFAPSPTGALHIGGVRTALFAWLYARHHGGQFILRIEDTDRERSTQEAVQIILEGMHWLGLDSDEGPFYQTQRLHRYKAVIQQLLDSCKAYYCYCSKQELEAMRAEAMARGEKPKYNGTCRSRKGPAPAGIDPVVRFRNPPDGEVVVKDLIQGRVVFQNGQLDDLIIARADGTPTYNLTVVVDDLDMSISHVIRGDDHLNNTPRQINLFDALGMVPPSYAHLPMILGPDGKKLSKRDAAASVLQYRDEGFLPEALLNYLVRLGWSHGDQEIFSVQEMVRLFDIRDVNRAAAALNPDKLLWLNQHYLKTGDSERLTTLLEHHLKALGIATEHGPRTKELVEVQQARCKTLKEMAGQSRFFYEDFDDFDETAAKKQLRPVVLEPLVRLRACLASLPGWDNDAIHHAIDKVANEFGLKLGKIAQPLRVAVTGAAVSPSIDDTLRLIGRDRTLGRLDRALDYIRQRTTAT